MKFTVLVFIILTQSQVSFAEPSLKDLDTAIAKSNWDEASEISHEILGRHQNSTEAKLKGAYALFQKGYSNSALVLLRTLSPEDWKSLPQGQDRFVEVVSLFQKKIPLNFLPWRLEQIDIQKASPYMADELRFLKGKAAYDRHHNDEAKNFLSSVSKNSRFHMPARYLLGSILAEGHDYPSASVEFSEVFQPAVLDQSAEFWKDVGAQMTSHWGSNFKVMLDTELISKNEEVAELSLLALARIAYASKDYETALKRYGDIPPQSTIYSRAVLEKVWTLWALNRHSDAQKVAGELAVEGSTFSTIEAHLLRALILTDSEQTDEARKETENFDHIYSKSKAALTEYQQRFLTQVLPDFIQFDLDHDVQLQALKAHQKSLDAEIKSMKNEDLNLFPVYSNLFSELEIWKNKSIKNAGEIINAHVEKRMADLERLNLQSKLIVAETYLEDREMLKTRIKGLKIADEKTQSQYDEELIDLLQKAIEVVDEPFGKLKGQHGRIQFRQAELLWELGTAKLILGQARNSPSLTVEGNSIRAKSLSFIDDLAAHDTTFPRYNQVLFFKGFADLELGKIKDAVQTFHTYVQKFPRHEHIPDAFRILGDLEFDENHFAEAEQYYKKVLEFPDSPLVGYALYKLGWCAYNEKLFARALLALEKAYMWTAQSNENKLLGLQKETRHDLISIYAEVGDDHKAVDYFKRFSASTGQNAEWLEGLTQEYENGGQFEKAQNIYKALIDMDPNATENMGYISGIIQSEFKLQRWDLVISTLKDLASRYGLALAVPKADSKTQNSIEKNIREVVNSHRNDFKRSSDVINVNRVVALDRLYLDIFKQWPQSEEPLYRHAQYLLEKNHIDEAKNAFKEHWMQFEATLKEPLKEEALRNLIHTLGSIVEKQKEISNDVKDIFAYAVQYRTLYPNTKYRRAIDYLYSSTLLKYGRVEDGIVESQALYDQNGSDEIGLAAFKNLTKAYYDLKDWQRTFNWAKNVKGHEAQVQTIREESYFLWAENTSDDVKSAELFLKVTSDPKMQSIWDKSLYNAFIRFNKANKKYEAIQVAEQLEKIFPRNPALVEISGMRAAIYQEAGDYARALPYFEVFLKNTNPKTPPEAIQQAHLNAALISEAMGQEEKARLHYSKLTKKEVADRNLARVGSAVVNDEVFGDWINLIKERDKFTKNPLIAQADLVAELKSGALRLQKISQHFLDVAHSDKTPVFYAVESYCSVPFFYATYSKAVRALSGKDKDLRAELEKVAKPIDAKALEFAQGCIDGAIKADSGGPMYEDVVKKWGWQQNPKLAQLASTIEEALEKKSPWLEPLPLAREREIIIAHLKGESLDLQSWQQLARTRFQNGQLGLSRLTYIDALNRNPTSGTLLNGFACVEQKSSKVKTASGLFKKAGELGSGYAWVNEGLLQLKAHRLPLAQEAFKKALLAKAFDEDLSLKQNVEELTGP